jgi:hypothetical protein
MLPPNCEIPTTYIPHNTIVYSYHTQYNKGQVCAIWYVHLAYQMHKLYTIMVQNES